MLNTASPAFSRRSCAEPVYNRGEVSHNNPDFRAVPHKACWFLDLFPRSANTDNRQIQKAAQGPRSDRFGNWCSSKPQHETANSIEEKQTSGDEFRCGVVDCSKPDIRLALPQPSHAQTGQHPSTLCQKQQTTNDPTPSVWGSGSSALCPDDAQGHCQGKAQGYVPSSHSRGEASPSCPTPSTIRGMDSSIWMSTFGDLYNTPSLIRRGTYWFKEACRERQSDSTLSLLLEVVPYIYAFIPEGAADDK
ncbi:uncharacterized protein J3D65DRAFT_670653 [Phyllosticta citribraziliensis]|uniref:Uncharacterized protein n=1 Tax=Phyllosticta citribraziliensis TaxID=989973 RepID=A0ABR1L9U5_9PEZI